MKRELEEPNESKLNSVESGFVFLMMYVLAPEKFVMVALRTVYVAMIW